MNYMENVAKLLGVNIGEEFKVKNEVYNPFRITEEGMLDCDGDVRINLLQDILTGKNGIIKLPWEPKEGENFYFVCVNGEVVYGYHLGLTSRYMAITLGNCFRTEKEAEEHKDEILEKLGVKL